MTLPVGLVSLQRARAVARRWWFRRDHHGGAADPGRVPDLPALLHRIDRVHRVARMTDHLPVALRSLWHELPLLAVIGVLTCTAYAAVVVLMPGVTPGSVLLSALLVAPVWAGVTATTDSVVLGGRGGVLLLLQNLKRHWRAGLEVGLVPGVVAALALVNWALYSGPLVALPRQ